MNKIAANILVPALLICFGFQAFATPPTPALKDEKLVALFHQLADAEGYTYNTSITSTLLSDPKKKDVKQMTSYLSREHFLMYSRSSENLFILCSKGQFRVNHKDRTVWYKKFENDSMLALVKRSLMKQTAAVPLDSLLLTGATVTSRKETADKISYKLSYPKGAQMISMDVVYRKAGFFESIAYQYDRPLSARAYAAGDREGTVRQVVVMNGYVLKAPAELGSFTAAGIDTYAVLQQQYPGYVFKSL